jgi:hypothetical protein
MVSRGRIINLGVLKREDISNRCLQPGYHKAASGYCIAKR